MYATYYEALIMAIKDPTDYDKAKFKNPNKPPRKRVPKPKPGQSRGSRAKGAKK